MNSVGAILRTERERQGREVAEIAEELCITQRYLRAIEQDDLKSLPGAFFYKSFVRQYAAILRLDEAALHPGIEALTASLEPMPLPRSDQRYVPSPTAAEAPKPIRDLDPIVRDGNRSYFSDGRMGWSIAGLATVLLACSGFYSWYNKVPRATTAKSTVAAQRPLDPAPPVVVESPAVTPVKAESPSPAPATPSVDVSTTTAPDGSNHVVLNLSATEKTWISITSDGKQIFSGVLEPSQTKTLTGLEVAKMKVGNAGGLDVRWNGKSIGPIGPRGQVRVLLLTPEKVQILQPSEAM
jgi:cytoskeletal protein RodZ